MATLLGEAGGGEDKSIDLTDMFIDTASLCSFHVVDCCEVMISVPDGSRASAQMDMLSMLRHFGDVHGEGVEHSWAISSSQSQSICIKMGAFVACGVAHGEGGRHISATSPAPPQSSEAGATNAATTLLRQSDGKERDTGIL
jgi:hypothetical protein